MGLALGSQQAAQALVTAVQVVVYAREQTFGAARGGGGQGALEVRGRQGVVFPAEVQFPRISKAIVNEGRRRIAFWQKAMAASRSPLADFACAIAQAEPRRRA